MSKRFFALAFVIALLASLMSVSVFAQDATPEATSQYTDEQLANNPYLASVVAREGTMYDTSAFAKEGPYRIALAAQGTSNSWSALFDAHAFAYAQELEDQGILAPDGLLYADGQLNADIQVPQVEDLLAQEPDALILVPLGRAALSAPVERAMAQGVPVILCASGVETDNFVTEVGTNLFDAGNRQALWLADQLGGSGKIVQMNGAPGVDTAEIEAQGATAAWAATPGIEVLDTQYGEWSTAKAKEVMQQWIAQYGDEIQGIWAGGAQMAQGIVSAYEDAGLPVPPIAAVDSSQGFLRLAKELNLTFDAGYYPNAMVRICIDTALKILRGEPVPRFIDFTSEMPEAQDFTNEQLDANFHAEWSDDVFGPIFLTNDQLAEMGYLVEGATAEATPAS